jgi:hypothetical protein
MAMATPRQPHRANLQQDHSPDRHPAALEVCDGNLDEGVTCSIQFDAPSWSQRWTSRVFIAASKHRSLDSVQLRQA